MKHGSIKAVWLFVLGCIAVWSASSDELTVDLTSIILESFDGETNHEYNVGKRVRQYDFSWTLAASKFASTSKDQDGNEEQYPKSAYVEAWPIALFGYNRNQDPIKSFGINGRFDRQGYNWIDIYPVQGEGDDAEPFEIPMPGRVRGLDLWVWGSNLNYTLEAYVRDLNGIVHILNFGSLAYPGWKNLHADMPSNILQAKRILPNLAQLSFVKFRIWTTPREQVGNFYVYLKQFKILTDTFESLFDGDDLADPDHVPQLWANGGGNSGATN
jgi:hypothetical protein